jgi:hypothetical protein
MTNESRLLPEEEKLAALDLALRESAIGEGYSFEEDPFAEVVPPGITPEAAAKFKALPNSIRWLSWAKTGFLHKGDVIRTEDEGPIRLLEDVVVVLVGDVEQHPFPRYIWEELLRRFRVAAGEESGPLVPPT